MHQNRTTGYDYNSTAASTRRRVSAGPVGVSTGIGIGSPPGTPASADLRTPHTPSRRVVSEFKAFGSPAGSGGSSSVFGAPVLATGPGGGMFGIAAKSSQFGAARGGGMGVDDDDDEEEDFGAARNRRGVGGGDGDESDEEGEGWKRGPEMKTDTVSLDQVCDFIPWSVGGEAGVGGWRKDHGIDESVEAAWSGVSMRGYGRRRRSAGVLASWMRRCGRVCAASRCGVWNGAQKSCNRRMADSKRQSAASRVIQEA